MLELINIKKDYYVGDMVVNALKGLTISFRSNEFVSILGPSGCGKTTLLNIIGGLDHYTDGDLIIDNVSTKEFKDRDWDTYRNHRIGFIFQSYNLIPHQTILENVELALTIAGLKKEERIAKAKAALDEVGLKDLYNKKSNQLSGGQCQRVAIARALVNEPDILLADEPTGALDSETSLQIMDLIKQIAKNKLVIMVTHNPDLAYEYSTRIINLKDGLVVSDSNPLNDEEYKNEKELKNVKEISSKAKLSFWQTFRLSFRNLISKFKRTALVAFAGSIGIIGVSTVLAVSTGIQNYIHDMEEDMLSGNPIRISSETYDLSTLMSSLTLSEQHELIENATEDGIINVNYLLEQLIQTSGTMSDVMIHNEIDENYVNYINELDSSLYADITYNYGINFLNNLYTTADFEGLDEATYSLSGIIQMYTTMLQQTDFGRYAPFITTIAQPFDQTLNNEEYILEQYDIVSDKEKSHLPTKENEIMIVLSSDDALTDLVLGELGYYTQEEFFNIVFRAMNDERYDPSLDKNHFDFDELMDKKFIYYPNDSIYSPASPSIIPTVTTIFDYNYKETEKMVESKKGMELEITAILKPKEGVNYGSLASGFYYTPALAEKMLNDSKNSQIVKYFNDNNIKELVTTVILESGMMPIIRDAIMYQYPYYFDGELSYGYGFVGSLSMLSSSSTSVAYTLGLDEIGGKTIPSSISIYPEDFNLKDEIIDYLNKWNEEGSIFIGDKEIPFEDRSEVIYSDNLQLIINLVNNMINIVTYALIAFTALSLVVSTVMIAIITYVSVVERVKEIGVIRSLGGRKKDVSRLFYSETMIEGLSSGVLGIAVTYLISFILNMILGSLTGVYSIAALTPVQAIIMILVSVILTSISGIIPAKLAAKKDPAEALRTE